MISLTAERAAGGGIAACDISLNGLPRANRNVVFADRLQADGRVWETQ